MRFLTIAAALAFAAALPVQAQTTAEHKPAKAACHAKDGRAIPCPPKPARGPAKTSMPMISRCRDITSHHLTKCSSPNAEPVPAS